MPKRNVDFWAEKIRRNRERDLKDTMRLEQAGWKVIRFWGCEVKRDLDRLVSRIHAEVRR
jgi:DNA mismatch endonuclease (patch repair protein)